MCARSVLPPPPPESRSAQALSREEPARLAEAEVELRQLEVLDLLPPVAQVEAQSLRDRLGGDLVVYSSTISPSQVLSTRERNLLPPSCRSLVESAPPDYEAAARCFTREHHNLLRHRSSSEGSSEPTLRLLRSRPGGGQVGDEQFLRFEQEHLGTGVRGRSIKFAFLDRRLVVVAGRYEETANFVPITYASEELEAVARSTVGPGLVSKGYEYDPDTGRPYLRLIDSSEREHRFDAVEGTYLGARDTSLRVEVPQAYHAYRHLAPTYLGLGSSPIAHAGIARCEKEFPFQSGSCLVAGSGYCRYWPKREGFYPDRASAVFTTPLGGSMTEVSGVAICGTPDVLATVPFTSTSDLRHYAVSARRNLDDLADMIAHSESFFWAYPRDSMDFSLDINANSQSENPGGVYFSGPRRLRLYQDPWVGGRENARTLSSLGHEFGHFVHHTYGLDGDAGVKEGWAEHVALRIATHRRFVTGEWPALTYETPHGVGMEADQIQRVRNRGEFIADVLPLNLPDADDSWLVYPNSYCGVDAGRYVCGRLINLTYWTLVHDQCRLKFLDCSHVSGQSDIIRHTAGGYHNSAWRLANSAYAYAIANISGSGNVAEFHNLVAARYAQFRSAGYISASDEGRVLSVLAAHCLGPANVCSAFAPRLPGSLLPSAYTEKDPLFREAEQATSYSGTTFKWFMPFAASGHQYLAFGANGQATFEFNIAETGYYRVHLVTQPQHALADELQVRDPYTQAWKVIGPFTPHGASWSWRTGTGCNGVVRFATFGQHTLEFSTTPSTMEQFFLDALWLEKVSTVCP